MFQEFIACHKKIDFFTLSETFLPSSNIQTPRIFSILIAVDWLFEIAMTEKVGEKLCMWKMKD